MQLAIGGWLAANVGLIALAGGHLPFHASSLAQPPTVAAVLSADAMLLFHLDNMVIRTGRPVTPAEALCWAGYNFIAFAVLPFAVFRRRYSSAQLSLRSANRRGDLLVILVVLVLESAVQLSLASSSILHLTPHQVLLGAPLTFALSFAGTVLPTMVFIYCILTPRYLRLTGGSVPTTVILGGLTYALLHFFDGWTDFTTPTDALLSML